MWNDDRLQSMQRSGSGDPFVVVSEKSFRSRKGVGDSVSIKKKTCLSNYCNTLFSTQN